MPLRAKGRIMQVEKGRTLVYVSRSLADDSAWPFEPGEEVELVIDPEERRLIVSKLPKKR